MTRDIPAIFKFQNMIRPDVSAEVPGTRSAAVGVSTNFNGCRLAEHSGGSLSSLGSGSVGRSYTKHKLEGRQGGSRTQLEIGWRRMAR